MRILFIGNAGGTNVAESLLVAARALGHEASLVPAADAFRTSDLRRRISWHLLGHRPPRLKAFSARVLEAARAFAPDHIIATGLAPVSDDALRRLAGSRRSVFLTDDPWHPGFTAHWFFDAVLHYDVVFTPRHANLSGLVTHGCADVRYLRFGYDPRFFYADPQPARVDAFFAGGADEDRVRLLQPILTGEFTVELAGDFWADWKPTRAFAQGHYDPAELRRATAAARVNLVMVRAANRDGHVMRSFEAPAVGGALLVQDTADHRELFGDDVVYFVTSAELLAGLRRLLADASLRERLALAVHRRITGGRHTYRDRLVEMLG
ncbi:MAG: CgeB family protein [Gemmatimonadota bacterium]